MTVRVYATSIRGLISGAASRGSVCAVPSIGTVRRSDGTLLLQDSYGAVLDSSDGGFELLLPPTDDPTLSPTGWYYTLTLTVGAVSRSWYLEVPIASPSSELDVTSAMATEVPTGLASYLTAADVDAQIAAAVAEFGPSGAALPAVRITTVGSTFSPVVELAAGVTGVTVSWEVEETGTVTTGLTPTLTLGTAATRHVLLTATDAAGRSRLGDITTLNLGYLHTDDAGRYGPGAGYDHAAQAVSGISGVRELTGLVRLLAANISTLVGTLDCTGLSSLEYLECFGSRLQRVILTGCDSLIRVCLEANNLTTLNLNPVAGNLCDLRAAIQQGGALAMAPLSGDLASDYHFCVRDQDLTADISKLTAVEELWIWNTGQTGAFAPASPLLRSVMAYNNAYTTADLTGLFPAGRDGLLWLQHNSLTSVTLDGCDGLGEIDLSSNSLAEAAIDAVLAEVASWGTSNGSIDLSDNVAPSSAGLVSRATLVGRGWTVTVDATEDTSGGVLSDDFERADATGLVAVAYGWASHTSSQANIVSGDLVNAWSGYGVVHNPAGGALPANYSVVVVAPGTIINSTYFGIVGRLDPISGHGVRLLFASSTNISVGDATGPFDGNISLSTPDFPASWSSTAADHTIILHMSGTTITVEIDGHTVCTGTCSINAAATGTSYGVCGDTNGQHWRSIGTTQP